MAQEIALGPLRFSSVQNNPPFSSSSAPRSLSLIGEGSIDLPRASVNKKISRETDLLIIRTANHSSPWNGLPGMI
jgi:hypothetical protein